MNLPPRVQIVEVGPRDGLQNEPAPIAAPARIDFVNRLADAGHTVIEVGAFVSPRWVPQMAGTAEVFAGLQPRSGVRYTALVPNLAGLERAQLANVAEVAIFPAASETFSRRNLNHGIEEALSAARAVCEAARAAGQRVRGYLSTVLRLPVRGQRSGRDGFDADSTAAGTGCLPGRAQRHHRSRTSGPGA